MRVLVTGGAGYIGSHAVRQLMLAGHDVVVLDNLSRGHREAVPKETPLYERDLRDTQGVLEVLRKERIEGVMHFAAFTYVGESVEQPLRYYDNNTGGTCSLLSAMREAEVSRLVFSSTAATYGEPTTVPIVETERQLPINPYGRSKLFIEAMLADLAVAWPSLSYAALRYFNVAGCAVDGSLGEDHDPETHLIPVILQVALGQRPQLKLYGDDYPTPDGTCIRDYVHVEDLVSAHIAVMDRLRPGDARHYNLGIGHGYSVREVIDAARKVTGHPIPVEVVARRAGDPPALFSCPDRILSEINWKASLTELSDIIETAWRWFRNHPHGYRPR